jgi:hypothetical protein
MPHARDRNAAHQPSLFRGAPVWHMARRFATRGSLIRFLASNYHGTNLRSCAVLLSPSVWCCGMFRAS